MEIETMIIMNAVKSAQIINELTTLDIKLVKIITKKLLIDIT